MQQLKAMFFPYKLCIWSQLNRLNLSQVCSKFALRQSQLEGFCEKALRFHLLAIETAAQAQGKVRNEGRYTDMTNVVRLFQWNHILQNYRLDQGF